MFVYLAVLAAAVVVLALTYRYDLYDREPWWLVLAALGGGFVTMGLVGQAENETLAALRPTTLAGKAAIVAIFEDGAKLLVVMLIALVFVKHFNDPIDGLIYGTLVGLGAAVEESLMYIQLAQQTAIAVNESAIGGAGVTWASIAGAEVIRIVAHALLGGVAGFGVGVGARPNGRRVRRPALKATCLLTAVILHFAWDLIAYQRDQSTMMQLGAMALMVLLILTWGALVVAGSRRSRSAFDAAEDAPAAQSRGAGMLTGEAAT